MSNAGCAEHENLIYLYAEGLLDAQAAARVEEHLGACAGCRALVEQVRAVNRVLDGLPRASVPAGFAAGVTRRLASCRPAWQGQRRPWEGLLRSRAARPAVATALVAAVILVIAGASALMPKGLLGPLEGQGFLTVAASPRQAVSALPAAMHEAGAFIGRATREYVPVPQSLTVYLVAGVLLIVNVFLYATGPNLGHVAMAHRPAAGHGPMKR